MTLEKELIRFLALFHYRFRLTCRVKTVHWDCPWEIEDDSNLLKGVYEYGMGSWEAIKMDPELELNERVMVFKQQLTSFID